MRCSSTVSAPVQHCCAPLSAHHSRYIAVQLLSDQVLYFVAETKSKTKDVFAQTCIYLASQGMVDCELFGLAIVCDGEYLFVDPDSKLSKYAPKNWKSSSSHGLDGHGNPVFVLHFRIQFYIDNPILLRDELTRHHYYLQLRDNAMSRGAVSSEEMILVLAGYALQADFGDYNETTHNLNYFEIDNYFPKEHVSRNNQQCNLTAVALHKDNRGLTQAEAELHYIREASSVEISPLPLNLHLYRLKSHKKQEMDQTTVWLAICATGIQIYEETSLKKTLSSTFQWNNIGKLCFDRKKFEIRALSALGEKLTYYTNSDEKSKHLLLLCRVTHQFSMTLQSKLTEVKKKEEEERKKFRDCYGYSRGLTSDFSSLHLRTNKYNNGRGDQRISVISNTSSNTTSGIVSDRVQSLDESEDDLEIEIMINSPPANSVESLALEHLRDSPDSSGPVSSSDGHDVTDAITTTCHQVQKSSPSIAAGGAATPATTDGSQCSSSCSTVVIAGLTQTSYPTKLPTHPRRNSTTSSLELGYSHTAQNSTVSDSTECLELDLSVQSAQDKTDTTSSGIEPDLQTNGCSSETSGVYTRTNACSSETSGVYTRTNACSSETSGVYTRTNGCSSEASGVYTRERSESNAGSFHGDGSDPSEAGKGSLLTPEELSDLIVGRSPGSYPLRATVSHTLDSDSDYVTLPPPPRPPPPPFPEHLRQNYLQHQKLKRPTSLQNLLPQQQMLLSQQNLISQQQQLLEQLQTYPMPEEVSARFVTTKPHINIITAHSNVSSPAAPCYASPTTASSSSSGYDRYSTYSPIYHSFDNRFYNAGDTRTHPPATKLPPTLNSSYLTHDYLEPTFDPGSKMKVNPILVGKNNYLDIHRSKNLIPLRNVHSFNRFAPLPPPTMQPRQPPPPPPLATVYTSQVTRSQIEQFKQQLYSDVDYVIYPMKDPAISKQEYMDAKQGSLIAAMAGAYYQPPPPYPCVKNHVVYRSTPNVATGSGYLPMFTNQPITTPPHKYSSNTNLNEPMYPYRTYFPQPSHYSSTSPLYSAASYSSSSSQSLRFDPAQLDYCIPHPLSSIPGNNLSFTRTRSDDNILNYEKPVEQPFKHRRLPPPPPPPPYETRVESKDETQKKGILKVIKEKKSPTSSSKKLADDKIDIHVLRERSKHLDLPLISALCNDKSLLKQTNAFVMPRHPGIRTLTSKDRPPVSHLDNKHFSIPDKKNLEDEVPSSSKSKTNLLESLFSSKSSKRYASSSKLKYPVSGLSTTQISKPLRKVSSAHVHPKDGKSALSFSSSKNNLKTTNNLKNKDTIVP